MGIEQERVSWDPYEVWSTRVRGTLVGGKVSEALPAGGNNWPVAGNAIGPRKAGSPWRISSLAVVWGAFALAVVLGLNWELVGIFRIDLVANVFGVMTPAARVAHIVLGVSVLYCAVKTVVARRSAPPVVNNRR